MSSSIYVLDAATGGLADLPRPTHSTPTTIGGGYWAGSDMRTPRQGLVYRLTSNLPGTLWAGKD